ncbi:glycosyltransferase [Tumebacillus permanentifrigoris]|uniref:Glycosyl transferase family 4 n=1 Tax=Tumebacillus permanentifrigoris TaxID=378543 RepID=A0A316DES8_9BACL|nr:glycosyltransferase [Tumebacillus permanentifrigoris]PWK15679.1 glycosyl transferase family 4 [Tumebacillus permanentifrigoris]
MKKMLMISYYAPPQLNAESILVAKTLKFLSRHFQVDLITVGEEPEFRTDPFLLEEMGERVQVRRLSNPKPSSRVFRKLYRETVGRLASIDNPIWLRAAETYAGMMLKPDQYDVLYSRSQPGSSHLAALHMKKRFGLPWIAQFSDPWAHNPYHPYTGRKKQVIEGYEREVVEQADKLVFPTQEMLDLYAAAHGHVDIKSKSIVLPHHYDPELYTASVQGTEPAKIRLAYIGDFYGLRSPEPLVKALRVLKERRPDLVERLELQVVGNVERTFHPLLEEAEQQLGMTVQRIGQVPYRQSLELMAQTDVLLLVDAPSDVNLFLSSKLIDYLGARRPVLGITSTKGTAGRLLQEYGWQVHHPDNIASIADALELYLSQLEQQQAHANAIPVDRFSSEHVVGQLAELCVEAMNNQIKA